MADDSFSYDLDGNEIKHEQEPVISSQLKKVQWDKMGTYYLPVTRVPIMENGREVHINSRAKFLMTEVIADCLGIFDLINDYNVEYGIQEGMSPDTVVSVGLNPNYQPIFRLNPGFKGDWVDYVRNTNRTKQFEEFLKIKQIDLDPDTIAGIYIMTSVAHEMYHIRQYYQDFDYFAQGLKDNIDASTAADEVVHFEKYYLSPSERSARAFEIKYARKLLEKLKQDNHLGFNLEILDYYIIFLINFETDISRSASQMREERKRSAVEAFELLKLIYGKLDGDMKSDLIQMLEEKGIDPSFLEIDKV